MKHVVFAALWLCAWAARGDVVMAWSKSANTIVVAHGGRIEAFDGSGEKSLWSAEGPEYPSAAVVSPNGKYIAILNALTDDVAIVSTAARSVTSYHTPTTPVAGAFFGDDAWIVLRDSSRVERITPDGVRTSVAVALDPALIAASDSFVYVYSRVNGLLQEIDPAKAEVRRAIDIMSGGSDLEIRLPKPGEGAGAIAYLCRAAVTTRIIAIDLVRMTHHEIKAGATPVDLAFVPFDAQLALAPGTSVIADPGRAALYASARPGASVPIKMPTPADRLSITGAGVFALDSHTGALYRYDGRTVKPIATGVTATSFVATDDALFTWDATNAKLVRVPVAR